MAKKMGASSGGARTAYKKRRKGVHAKKKTSKLKKSKRYNKKYKGQGR